MIGAEEGELCLPACHSIEPRKKCERLKWKVDSCPLIGDPSGAMGSGRCCTDSVSQVWRSITINSGLGDIYIWCMKTLLKLL